MSTITEVRTTREEFNFQPEGLVAIDEKYLDTRSDIEITAILKCHQPVTTQRNVWAIWGDGLEKMPEWCLRNVISWVRRLGPSWTVRVVDLVSGSPNQIYHFVDADEFPSNFNDVLPEAKHGGVYMDVSTLIFRSLDDICWSALEDPKSPYKVALFEYQCRKHFGQVMNNFIACTKGDPFIKNCKSTSFLILGDNCLCLLNTGHAIFCSVWQDSPSLEGAHAHPLLRHLGLLEPDDPGFGENPDFTKFTDYAAHMLSYERLRLLEEPGQDGFSGTKYFKDHIFLLSAWKEEFYGQDEIDGEELYQLLSLDFRPKDSADKLQQRAKEFVIGLLSKSAIAKFGESYWHPGMPLPLPTLWKKNPGSDCKPGTWAAYLRWASVHMDQTRRLGRCLEPIPIPDEKDTVVQVKVLEPVA
ncbi:hypothetical protein FH972_025872 [Carpinus fangiana]|uniref:Capsule polysaccharide biosynthesis protein n=1 Tax=Carpinus fangiana TaxID=176857 RepID=A0A5N6L2A0_9ROSI|nr:hypothetical protein FH972_025872 [Carpinus fangiana]